MERDFNFFEMLLLTAVIFFISMEVSARGRKEKLYTFENVKYVRNYDADTITVDIPNVHPIIGDDANIRIRGLDTPELRTDNKCEKELARYGKNLVKSLLRTARRIDLVNCGKGKYFRMVCDVIYDKIDLKMILLANKIAYPYDGGTKEKIDWCNKLKKVKGERKKTLLDIFKVKKR